MIARHEAQSDRTDVWSKLAAPLPSGTVAWRQDGKPVARDGRFFARFVAYVEANTVRERLDGVVPGEWDLTLELLPPMVGAEDDEKVAFKGRLQILGVIREDVGTGRDYKAAATDTLKRCAVRFGIGHELYAMEQNWVQVDGDGKYAKPLEDPQAAYDRRYGASAQKVEVRQLHPDGSVASATVTSVPAAQPAAPAKAPYGPNRRYLDEALRRQGMNAETAEYIRKAVEGDYDDAELADLVARVRRLVESKAPEVPVALQQPKEPEQAPQYEERDCPKCGGRMWDNRASKRNPKAPDFKCRDRSCDGVVWPPRNQGAPAKASPKSEKQPISLDGPPLALGADDIPF